MNVVFSSDKKEYNTIKKGTEILLAEKDGFNQNIELLVKFQDRPEILINKRKTRFISSVGNISLLYAHLIMPYIMRKRMNFNIKSMSEMDKIRDSADILQPEKEETGQFIEKLLSSVKENFLPTGYILEWMRLSCWDSEII